MDLLRLVPSTTAAEREVLEAQCTSEDGVKCACCGHVYRVYKRPLHAEMAWFLLKLVAEFRETGAWVHSRSLIPNAAKASTDAAYFTAWGLVLKAVEHGFYKPTFFGVLFADGELLAPSHAYINNNQRTCLGFTDKLVSIHDALLTKFNYEDLMDPNNFTRKNGDPL